MKGVRGLEGGVGMLVGTPMGTMGEDSKGVRVSDAEADDVIAKRVAMGDR